MDRPSRVRDRRQIESARKENVLSDKENKDTKEDEVLRLENDESDSADVEGHKLVAKTHARSEDGEESDAPDVEGHRYLTKSMPKSDDGEEGDTPDVEAHRYVSKVVPRNHL
jgi:hypothetical protein